jgi:hypothetical protein
MMDNEIVIIGENMMMGPLLPTTLINRFERSCVTFRGRKRKEKK